MSRPPAAGGTKDCSGCDFSGGTFSHRMTRAGGGWVRTLFSSFSYLRQINLDLKFQKRLGVLVHVSIRITHTLFAGQQENVVGRV